MIFHFILQSIFALAGLISMLAAIGNWNWFFSTQSARSILPFRHASRGKLRCFYFLLGIVLIVMAVYFYAETRKAF